MPANFKKFDVKHGLSVNGLEFVDANRNVTLNNLTVQGTSTVVDTRTVSTTDPIISLGASGSTRTISSITAATPGRLFFSADDFADVAVGDSFEYNSAGSAAAPLVSGTIYYVLARETDVNSSNYRSITIAASQGGTAINITNAGSGAQTAKLNPLQDLGQDLGIEFNYVSGGAKKGFFGYDESEGHFTFLLDTTYSGSSTVSDTTSPVFTGTKSGAEFSYAKLQPTGSLTSNASALDIDQTWNAGGATFKAVEIDVVDTASAADSSLLDISVGGNQELLLRKDGVLSLNTSNQTGVLTLVQDSGTQATTTNLIDGTSTWNAGGSTFIGLDLSFTQTAYAAASKLVSISASADRNFVINAEGEIVSRSEFTGGGLQTGLLVDVTDTSSANNSLLLDLQVGNTSKFSVDKDGDVIAAGDLTIEGSVTINGTGNFEDTVTIQSQTNGTGTYSDSTELQSSTATISAGSSAATNVNSFTASSFTTAKLLVQVKQGSNIHSTELMLIHDGTDVYMTEYGTVYNSDIIVTFDAIVTGGNVEVRLTKTAAAITANSLATVKVTRTAIAS
jgi:hypothetical protein